MISSYIDRTENFWFFLWGRPVLRGLGGKTSDSIMRIWSQKLTVKIGDLYKNEKIKSRDTQKTKKNNFSRFTDSEFIHLYYFTPLLICVWVYGCTVLNIICYIIIGVVYNCSNVLGLHYKLCKRLRILFKFSKLSLEAAFFFVIFVRNYYWGATKWDKKEIYILYSSEILNRYAFKQQEYARKQKNLWGCIFCGQLVFLRFVFFSCAI